MLWRRREVLRWLAGGAIGAAAAACARRLPLPETSSEIPPSPTRIPVRLPGPERWEIASPVPITPTPEFYEVKYRTIPGWMWRPGPWRSAGRWNVRFA
jgi:hypothetical protein